MPSHLPARVRAEPSQIAVPGFLELLALVALSRVFSDPHRARLDLELAQLLR